MPGVCDERGTCAAYYTLPQKLQTQATISYLIQQRRIDSHLCHLLADAAASTCDEAVFAA